MQMIHQAHEQKADKGYEKDHRKHPVIGIGLDDPCHIDAQPLKTAQPLGDHCPDDGVGGRDF